MAGKSLYERLGGYDAITAFANNLLPRLKSDSQLGRFWEHRGDDGIEREKQLLIDYLCANAGGPMYYTGRDMKTSHQGMRISESDWSVFLQHAGATMEALQIPKEECDDVVAFVLSLKDDVVVTGQAAYGICRQGRSLLQGRWVIAVDRTPILQRFRGYAYPVTFG